MRYIFLALLPIFILLPWLYTKKGQHRTPKREVYRLFLLGAAIVLPAGLLERAILDAHTMHPQPQIEISLFTAFFGAGLVEEFLKAAIVERGAIARGLIKRPFDCLMYAGATALGFAAVENVLYVSSSGFSTAVLRSVTAVPAHLMFGLIMGTMFAKSIWNHTTRAFAYIVPALAHGVYDTFALANSLLYDVLLVVYLLILMEWSLRTIERFRRFGSFAYRPG